MDNITKFKEITHQMADVYERKNADYGNSFDQSLDKHGTIAAIVRMEDKMNRVISLTKNKQRVNDEAIEDTLTDLANYAIMTRMWLESKKQTDEQK